MVRLTIFVYEPNTNQIQFGSSAKVKFIVVSNKQTSSNLILIDDHSCLDLEIFQTLKILCLSPSPNVQPPQNNTSNDTLLHTIPFF